MSLRALQIARSSLLAQQAGVEVTSGNIANVNTPGYARRRLHMSPLVPQPGQVGSGVIAQRVEEFRNSYLEAQLRATLSRQSRSQTDALLLQRIEALLGEPTAGTGIAALLKAFFDAVQEVAVQPENLALREVLLQRADALAAAFRRLGTDLQGLRHELYEQLQQRLEQLNPLLQRLAQLNAQRALAPEGSENALALATEQAQLLEQLASWVPVSAQLDAQGMLTVSIAGHRVVSGMEALRLELRSVRNPDSGEQSVQLWLVTARGEEVAALPVMDGEIGGLLWHFNVTLDPAEQSGNFSVPRALNAFVARWVERVNALVATGYGLDDSAAPPPGRRLFVGDTLETLRLAPEVAANPRALPLSDAPGQPGNAAIAWQLLALAEDTTFADGMTPQGAYTAVLTRLGQQRSAVQSQQEWLSATLQQLQAQREALSGVNLDEEATNLIRYQKAYEAAARVLTVAASLLDTLIRMGA